MISRFFALFYLFLVLLALGFAISTHHLIPANAIILIDEKNKIYYSPNYFETYNFVKPPHLKHARLVDIFNTDIKPDEDCWNKGCFVEFPVSINQNILEKLGLLKPRQRRWDSDGNWNY